MNFIDFVVRNPVKTTVGVLLLALFGLIALTRMPMQLTPEVQIPTLTVETLWRGASPQEVEREIIHEQEEQLKSVEGITKLSSEAMDSMGRVTLEFNVGTDMEEALLKVNSRLQQVPEYPEDADEPVIATSNSSDRPIAWFILSGKQSTVEEIEAFQEHHPELKEVLAPIVAAPNPGVRLWRLREAAIEHPELKPLLPPDAYVPGMRRFAEDMIEARFERVNGVSNSNILGGLEEELQVIVDPRELATRELTITDVRNALRGQNKDTSGGDFWEGKRRYVIRTLGQFDSKEDVENQILAMRDGAPVFVRDVGVVQLGYKKPDGVVRRFGDPSLAINCLRETNANVLDVMAGLREATDELNERVLAPRGLQMVQVYDETEYIYSSVGLVQQNIFIGGALTMIVLMLFLHRSIRTLLFVPAIAVSAVAAAYISPWFFVLCIGLILVSGLWFARGALVVGLAIPTSIVGTFLVLDLLGRSLNVISLAGLAFAVGMLVDNAVVVLENIYRRYQEGEPPLTAAVNATSEVWGAVAASTLTTLAVFLPVLFVEEEAGQLFRDIALAISGAVGLSLIVSITLIPTAAARLLKKRNGSSKSPENGKPEKVSESASRPEPVVSHQRFSQSEFEHRTEKRSEFDPLQEEVSHHPGSFILNGIDAAGTWMVNMIVATNAFLQGSVIRRLALVAGMLGASIFLTWFFWPKVEYLPTGNRNLVLGILLPPPGYNLDELMQLGVTVENGLRPYIDIDPDSPEAAALEYPVIGDFFFVARGRQVFMGVRAADPMRSGELVNLVREVGKDLPGAILVAKQSSLFENGLTGGRTIDIEITGPDLNHLVTLGTRVLAGDGEEGELPGISKLILGAQARPVPSLDLSSPEVHFVPKLVQGAELGMNSTDLGYTVDALIDGAYATDYYIGGDKIDLSIVGREKFATETHALQALPIATPTGRLVRLDSLARIELSSGPEQVNHRERQRAITIEVSPPPEMPLEDALDKIRTQIVDPLMASKDLDGGYSITLAGTADKLSDTWKALNFNLLFAAIITYLLMAALFESWVYPLVIISSVLLGMVGGVLGLNALNVYLVATGQLPQTLDVLTMLGFVILIGTVVNNAILIVHQSLNLMREDGMSPDAAILDSVRTRIRPIFMTTTTTLLGLLPLVVFPGAGSELYRGLGSVVLGGLLVSTIFTLFLVPSLFSLMMQLRTWSVAMVQSVIGSDDDESEGADEGTKSENQPRIPALATTGTRPHGGSRANPPMIEAVEDEDEQNQPPWKRTTSARTD